jgi:aminopeptidase
MEDPRVTKLAQVMVNYCVAIQPGQTVLLRGNSAGMPLVTATYREIVRAGGNPFLLWDEGDFEEIFYKEANDDQLQFIAPPLRHMYEHYDALIAIIASHNTRHLNSIPPARIQRRRQAAKELSTIYMKRAAAGELHWTLTQYPTPAFAQEADMPLSDYEKFVYGACHVDEDDPVAFWRKVAAEQQRLVDWLVGKKDVRVTGPNVDLRLSIEGRIFINADGTRNMPDGEIFTGPVEQSVNGWVRFTYPAIYSGREVDGVMLRFEDGKVVEASATKNEAFLLNTLDTDAGARYLGEFAIGTNHGIRQFTKSILYDEKIGGTIHMALGEAYPETGSHNQSAIHWDMICDMREGGKIWVDDQLFYDSGEFKI